MQRIDTADCLALAVDMDGHDTAAELADVMGIPR